jgi:MFS family permease
MAIAPTGTLAEVPLDETVFEEEAEAHAGRRWPSTLAAYWALTVIILATFLTFFDQVVFGMLGQRIKTDFGLTDSQLGFLAGPASIICYLFVGIPLARLADIYPRKYVLAGGVAVIGAITALGGIAQNYVQFVLSRVPLAAGGAAHGPSSYSLLADAFPPKKLTRAFALLQFGFIGGTTLGPIIGGMLIGMSAAWAPTYIAGLRILGWQWILIWTGLPGIVIALLFLTVKEPSRLPADPDAPQPPADAPLGRRILTFTGLDAAKAIHARRHVYYPLFAGLALSAIQVFGLAFWFVPFMIRSYGWTEARIGALFGTANLVASLLGLLIAGVSAEWLAKRYKDANVRAATIFFGGAAICSTLAPLMPNGYLAIGVNSVGIMFGLASAVPQNAAVQRVAPNAMRGQVTAIYLFMFTFFGAMGSFFVGVVQDNLFGVEKDLWKTMALTSAILLSLATYFMARAMKPYREEVEELERMGR